jgi:3-phenylpropionate/trans-cinnamate dioxygenase ferredoxin reductase subunit
MTTTQTFVIVGASLAGATAAETLRAERFDGRVVLIGEEPERPYERPPLSKDYLAGKAERHSVYVHDAGFYADQAIELRTSTRVTTLDVAAAAVVLDSGERIGYDRLLLSTGAAPRRLNVPGANLDGVHYLRSLADADYLRAALRQATNVAVVGAGWIGSEVAAVARQLGRPVAVIDPGAVPLERVLGPQVGQFYRDLHADHGVDLHLGQHVAALQGPGTVEQVRTTDGQTIPADLVVVGIGAQPRVELAATAGLDVRDGIVVDEHLQTTIPGIFAAGDVAAAWHPLLGTRIRVEHWANALNQGPAAAKNMLGHTTPYQRVPYFYSDQYDVGMEYSGHASRWDQVVFRGDPATREFVAFWLNNNRVVAGMNVNVWDVTDPIQQLIRNQSAVDLRRLTDPDIPLETLASAASTTTSTQPDHADQR